MDSVDFVSIRDLADILGMDRSGLRKYVQKEGFTPHKRRTPGSRNQAAYGFTRAEVETIKNKREAQGFSGDRPVVAGTDGVFYCIQLVPDLDANRIKFGFAQDLADRLSQHRTAAPTATVLRSWPCRRSWELVAMDAASRSGCRLLWSEVFECDDLTTVIANLDLFFQTLPSPQFKVPLSDRSPMKK